MDDSPFKPIDYGAAPQASSPAAASVSQQPDSPFKPIDYGGGDSSKVKAAQDLAGNQDYNGLCQTFVEKIQGTPKMGATAADAWNNWRSQGKAFADVGKAPAGAAVYFAPDKSNEDAGHVAISDGHGNIVGATDNGVQTYSVKDWIATTGQKPLGYVVP